MKRALCKTLTCKVHGSVCGAVSLKREFHCSSSNRKQILNITHGNIDKLLLSYDNFLLDCDGTLYSTDHVTPIVGIPKAIAKLQELGKKILYVTNNSMHSNDKYVNKFSDMGFKAKEEDVFGVANAAALYLKDIAKVDGEVYVLGTPGMKRELDKIGLVNFGVGPDPDPASWDPKILLNMEFRDNVQAVLIGFDEHFHYNKIFKACSYLTNPKCLYVATNVAETGFFLEPNRFQPTTGSLVQCISTAVKREPIVVGKPGLLLLDCIRSKHSGLDLSRTLLIGDGLKSDIAFANNVGIDSALVLTGSGSLSNIDGAETTPTYVMDSFALFGQI